MGLFGKHFCIKCGEKIKWYEKVIINEKIISVKVTKNSFTPYRYLIIWHKKCATWQELQQLKKQKEEKKRKKHDDDDDTTNNDFIRSE